MIELLDCFFVQPFGTFTTKPRGSRCSCVANAGAVGDGGDIARCWPAREFDGISARTPSTPSTSSTRQAATPATLTSGDADRNARRPRLAAGRAAVVTLVAACATAWTAVRAAVPAVPWPMGWAPAAACRPPA